MTDPSAAPGELTYTRIFDAPRELVFRCMITPEHLTHFWGPAGVSTPVGTIKVDPRPGGVFETVMVNDADGSTYPTSAVYLEVSEPERLVWHEKHSGVTTTTTFVDLGGSRTEVRIRQTNVPDAFRSPEAQAGFLTSLDKLAGHLGTTKRNELRAAIAAERRDLADVLAALPPESWDAPTLCAGWRVREVAAHMTMPFRYSAARFALELARSRGNFTAMSDRCARRDAEAMPAAELAAALRDNAEHPWQPPGGPPQSPLIHDVIHGLDFTVPLGIGRRVPPERLGLVLDTVTSPKVLEQFGVDLTGIELVADDLDWSFGSGERISGAAQHLLLAIAGRRLPRAALHGDPSPRFTAA
jgi:uncharacterized protein (TIGR03083 family)